MNNEIASFGAAQQKRQQSVAETVKAKAKQDGYIAGFEKGKRIYEYLVWALCLYGIVMTICYWMK